MFIKSCVHLTKEQSIGLYEVLIRFGISLPNMRPVYLLRESCYLVCPVHGFFQGPPCAVADAEDPI